MDLRRFREDKECHSEGELPGIGLASPLEDSDNQSYVKEDNRAITEFDSSGMHITSFSSLIPSEREETYGGISDELFD